MPFDYLLNTALELKALGLFFMEVQKMPYNPDKKARIKEVKALALRVKDLSDKIDDLEADMQILSNALLTLTNSVITNIQRGESS